MKQAQLFERPVGDDLKRASVTGGLSTMFAEALNQVLRVAGMVVLARLLMPEHFGIVGMVTALTSIGERFKDFGLDLPTLQRDEITHDQVSTLFWINAGVGILLALLVVAASPVIAWFYGEPRLIAVSAIMAVPFVFGGLSIQHQALLRRQMRFGALARVSVIATGSSFVLSLALARYGFTYWALVWKEVALASIGAAGAWLSCGWLPGLPRWSTDIRPMLKVGGSVTGFNFVYFLSRSLDQILIGRRSGAGPLGYYRQGYQLVLMPLNLLHFPVGYVAVPALSALRANREKYKAYYREITSLLALVCMPGLTYLAIHADIVVRLVLGVRWLPSVPIVRVMAVAGIVWPLVGTCGTVMMTCGRTTRYFWWGVGSALTLAVSLFIGVRWGSYGVAVAYAAWTYATLLPSLWISFRGTPLEVRDSLVAARNPAVASALMAAALLLLPVVGGPQIVRFLATLAAAGIFYLAALCLLPGGKAGFVRHVSYVASLCAEKFSRSRAVRTPVPEV